MTASSPPPTPARLRATVVGGEPDEWLAPLLARAGVTHVPARTATEAHLLIADDLADFLLESAGDGSGSFVVYAPATGEGGALAVVPVGIVDPAMSPAKLRGLVAHAVEWARRRRSVASVSEARARWRARGRLHREERELDGALEALRMAYQPIRDRGGRLLGHEALLRVATGPLRSPREVVDRADHLGRTGDLTRRVLREVARDAARLEGAIFVNLSWGDLHEALLLAPGSPVAGLADRLVLEVAEASICLSRPERTGARVSRLREAGYRIAFDGVGAGWTSLAPLAHIHPDFVKLDMRLTRGIEWSVSAQHLVLAITRYCHHVDVEVVASGVEASAERNALATLGCRYLQGYLIGEPAFLELGDDAKEVG